MAKKVKKKMPQRKPKTPFKSRNFKKPHPIVEGRGMGTGAGVRKRIETPEELWGYFEDYKQWCIDNAYEKVVGTSNGSPITITQPRPLVFIGFEGYLSIRRVVGYDLSNYERDESYKPTIVEIRNQCRMECVQGALAGHLNANLTARIEGIKENIDTTSGGDKITGQPIVNIYKEAPPLASDENEIDK